MAYEKHSDFSLWRRTLEREGVEPPLRCSLETLQVNLGYYCNQACTHCHVDAGPHRRDEVMKPRVLDRVIEWAAGNRPTTLDITGGAPELIPGFRRLVEAAAHMEIQTLIRTNLTALFEPGQEDLDAFLKEHRATLIASMPCYTMENVDRQRGNGAFKNSVKALKRLNELGYGRNGSGLELHLVYNPGGAFLPGPQAQLEKDYRSRLVEDYQIVFNNLLCLSNLPMGRFARELGKDDPDHGYWALLERSFNERTVQALMCRNTLSIDHEGYVYDCDFNQIAKVPLGDGPRKKLWELDRDEWNSGRSIAFRNYCLGCTAGAGSSCSGALD